MQNPLPDNKKPHLKQNIYTKQHNPKKSAKESTDVWQDNIALARDRIASIEPASQKKLMRSRAFHNKTIRTKNKHVVKRRTVPLTLWPDPILKTMLQQKAVASGISLSQAGITFLKRGMQADLDMEYGALLEPALERILSRFFSRRDNRLSWLLIRIAFDVGHTKVLSTNTLGMQEGMTEENLKEILATADKRTKANLTRKTPQLTELMEVIEKWLLEGEEEKNKN
jgi:hypothetical protein